MKNSYHLLAIFTLLGFTYFYQQVVATVPKQSLADFFEQEVTSLDNAVQHVKSEPTIVTGDNNDEGYFFRRFWLRLRPRVERDIPGLAGFSIIPEAELLWEKETPEGWEIYKIEKKKN